ncbi:hypothetical protein [Tenacibaculum sp. IB213877]|uniref:hypothetical protein n=1 Tax=Tenacibaculum sp. IB213877 TaxID=3097351 RepID=UPI002A59C4BA|nr:hypothetical protein [Tenacibaculum sp. IB213877]MDY0780819.1 hypothetical protein [Tenacibaculum sp. IB213877]
MKKSILNLGKTLNKDEQKLINGGVPPKRCDLPDHTPCPGGGWCWKGICGPVNPN